MEQKNYNNEELLAIKKMEDFNKLLPNSLLTFDLTEEFNVGQNEEHVKTDSLFIIDVLEYEITPIVHKSGKQIAFEVLKLSIATSNLQNKELYILGMIEPATGHFALIVKNVRVKMFDKDGISVSGYKSASRTMMI